VYKGDTPNVAKDLQGKGLKVVALNMASRGHPGGGWENGARAQEEALFRRTNYYKSLYPSENSALKAQLKGQPYAVPELGAIYSPGVTVFREDATNGFAFRQPFTVDMIASAAYNLAKGIPSNYASNTCEKIRAILRVAHGTGHDCVVLGAYGCGAFGNDNNTVAGFFQKVFAEPEFQGVFTEIAFAIIDDHNSKGSNLSVFQSLFPGQASSSSGSSSSSSSNSSSSNRTSGNKRKREQEEQEQADERYAQALAQEQKDEEYAKKLAKLG
jgi:uncharacterized protein (TIGR02452 family)